MRVPPPSIRFVSDQSLLIQWSGPPSMEINHWVNILFRRLAASRWEIENLHPAYSSLLVDFSPDTSPDEFAAAVRDLCDELRYGETMPGDEVQIEVIYDGADLDEISRQTGLSRQEIIRLHAEAEYHVAFLGFSPGFPYLMGLKEKLFCRRKEVPRLKVPAGSVAIAGFQTGIYPNESPGGWQLLGRTHASLFNPENEKPSLLSPGDRVRFVPRTSPEKNSSRAERKSSWVGHPLCEVLNPGPFTTIQDRGRLNQAHLGVSRGGAADPLALAVGNMLLGNSN